MAVPPTGTDARGPVPVTAGTVLGPNPTAYAFCAVYLCMTAMCLHGYAVRGQEVLLPALLLFTSAPVLVFTLFQRFWPAGLRSRGEPVRSRLMEGLLLASTGAGNAAFLASAVLDLRAGLLSGPLLVLFPAALVPLVPLVLGTEAYARDWWRKR